ncbi:exopolysaccharide production protein ExoY [Rhodovulum iodosum]|uniref:Exopolysaccharide production protein ExoY n=1 Tax=Rhodovulum iodosum TaxID=68291 RepID=A0ABV3XZQ2_9RHOB|nr:sugar transferase [Rhodovulum robiginosum]RSK38865.1 sugar transferase [Rhodovulum robiginosum]
MTLYLRDLPLAEPAETARVEVTAPAGGAIYADRLKRVFDIVFVVGVLVLAAPILVPLFLLILGIVALDGHSPIYRQRRVGRDGRVYDMLKVRTMVPDADARLQAHLEADPAARAEWGSLQKLRSDPRITRFGQFLRKSSLDEMPQLWNVMKGEMSLVGPRPMMENQKALYPGRAYYRMRPGITGLWQVSDRNHSTFADRAVFDAEYHARLSFWTDLRILARTVSVVLRGTGC